MDVVLPKAGRYVVAVSGGVDSMVLLHILRQQPDLQLTVAHFDHGIREDSGEDRKLIESVVGTLSVPLVCASGHLGKGASEATAREARYKFLRKVLKDTDSDAILTAHHQDDVLETAILNMLRGTGRKGLTSLGSGGDIIRPMLRVPKSDLVKYAHENGLEWREDSTNNDEDYLRNYVRHNLVMKLDNSSRQKFLKIIDDVRKTNHVLDTLLVKQLLTQSEAGTLDRLWFNRLPHEVARGVMAGWLRNRDLRDFDSKTLERLVVAAKTATAGKTFPVLTGWYLEVNKDNLALAMPER